MRSLIESIHASAHTGWVEDVKNLWESMVSQGERMPDVKRDQCWASIPDCLMLYLLVKYYKPKVVFEIGTYIGTSTNVMAMALGEDGIIHTCDRDNVYIPQPEYAHKIKYYNKESEKVLPKISGIDFCFADGTFRKGDAKALCRKMNKGAVFSAHDCYGDQKGTRNMRRILRHRFGNAYFPENYKVGYAVGGVKINSSVGVITW